MRIGSVGPAVCRWQVKSRSSLGLSLEPNLSNKLNAAPRQEVGGLGGSCHEDRLFSSVAGFHIIMN